HEGRSKAIRKRLTFLTCLTSNNTRQVLPDVISTSPSPPLADPVAANRATRTLETAPSKLRASGCGTQAEGFFASKTPLRMTADESAGRDAGEQSVTE